MSGFNGSGTYARGFNWVTDASNSINITASRVDADMLDVVNGFNICLTRDGQGKVSTDFDFNGFGGKNLKSGAANAPSLSFQSSTNSGFYLISSTQIGVTIGGTLRATFDNTGALIMTGAISGVGFTDTGTSSLTTVNVTNAVTCADLVVNGSTIPANGMYLPAANTLGFASNSTKWLSINSTGNIVSVAPSSGTSLSVNGVATAGVAAFIAVAGQNGYAVNFSGNTNGANWPAGTNLGLYVGTNFSGASSEVVFVNSNTAAVTAFDFRQQTGASAGRLTLSIASTGATTLSSPSSGNHQFNGLTQYSDGTTNAEIGWRSLPSSTFNGTLVATQRSQLLQLNGNITVPNAIFSAGDVVVVTSTAGRTITQGASVTLTLGGTATTGSRTLAANGVASILFTSSSAAIVYGAGVT